MQRLTTQYLEFSRNQFLYFIMLIIVRIIIKKYKPNQVNTRSYNKIVIIINYILLTLELISYFHLDYRRESQSQRLFQYEGNATISLFMIKIVYTDV